MDVESLGKCLSSFVDDGTVESHRYYLARRTVLEMLRDRGYAVPMAEIDISLQDFRDKYGQRPDIDRLKITALHKYDPDNKVLCSIVNFDEYFTCLLFNCFSIVVFLSLDYWFLINSFTCLEKKEEIIVGASNFQLW